MVSDVALVQAIASRHGVSTTQLEASERDASAFLASLRAQLQAQFPLDANPGVDVLVLGSLAKHHCTRGSDIDYFGLCETAGQGNDALLRATLEHAKAAGFDVPFAEGMNGAFAPRAELETIAINKDDLRRTFRRCTLVTASVSVYRPALRRDVVKHVLSAFIGRERQPRIRGVFDQLLHLARVGNIVSEWRLQDRTSADGGFVQWAKAFTLYKVELASALAATIRAATATAGRSRDELVDRLATELERTPLGRLLDWYDELGDGGKRALATILEVTDASLTLLGTPGVRETLAAANLDDDETRARVAAFEALQQRLVRAQVDLFYRDPVFRPWIEELGVFG